MNRWKRFMSAWSRHHRSGGFGIHSPYAYKFVRNVWRQRLPYYVYDGMHSLIDTIKGSTSRRQRLEMDLISEKEAKLLFRVTNFFNPQHILQMGASTGVESVAMLAVSHESRLFLYDPQIEKNALAVRVLQSQMDRVDCYDGLSVALDEFLAVAEGGLALVNDCVNAGTLQRLLDAGTVVILRRLNRNEDMWDIFDSCCDHMTAGQTYTNGKIAILNPNAKLQREDFLLWL